VERSERIAPLTIKSFLQKTEILDFLPDSVFIYDQNKNLIFANKAACEAHGSTLQELLGTNQTDIVAPEYAAKIKERMQVLLDKGETVFESAQLRKDGSVMPVESHVRCLKIEGQHIFFCTSRDITERKKVEGALMDSRKVLQMIFETVPTCIKLLAADGTLHMMNQAGLKMIEADSLDQVKGQCVYPMISEEDREAFKTLTQETFRGGSGTLEFRMIGLTGRPLWLSSHVVPLRNEKGEIMLSLAITSDITERKEMEEALRESSERYKRITEAITDYIYTVRVENGRPLETRHSEACVAVTGYTSREFDEDPYLWIKMVSEEDHDLVRRQAEDVLSGKTPGPIEHRIIRKDGSLRWVESTVVPHHDAHGILISYDGIVKDITERKKVEEEIRKSEFRLREAQHIGKIGDFETDVATGMMTWSDKLRDIFEIDAAHANIFTTDDFIRKVHPEDQQTVRDILKRNIEKKNDSWEMEYRIVVGSGDIKHLFASVRVEKDETGVPIRRRGTVQDITERKNAEYVLKERGYWLSESQKAANIGTYRYDVNSGTWLSTKVLDSIFGINDGYDKTVEGWLDIIHPGDREEMRSYLVEEVIGQRRPFNREYRIIRQSDNQERWVYGRGELRFDEGGNPLAMLGTIQDITDRKQTEEALSASEKKFRNLLENIQLLAVILDLNGNITFCNDYLLRLTEWSRDEVLNKNWFDIFLPDNVRGYVKSVFRANITRGTMLHHENPINTRKGALRQIVWDIAVLHDYDGNVTGTASIGIDVTEHRMLEEQLRQAQKMEAVGHLAGGIAHDFNNILSAIVGYSHLTLMKMKDNDPLRVNIEHILASSGRAANLIQSLLVFSRKQVILLKHVDVSDIMYDIKAILSRTIGEDIDFKADIPVKGLIVKADKSQIEQALMNLATNARDAMPHGGTLTITAEEAEINGSFIKMHQFGEPGRYAVITVADTGVGMDEKTKKNIFEPFFTTKDVGKGTGLGLAMVYGTIKQHNGYINVYSETGRGTTFKIYLPLAGPVKKTAVKEAAEAASAGSETILLVEDEQAVRVIVRSLLEESGYRVLEAIDGEEGLRLFKENREDVDLVLSDVVMPKMQGQEMYEEIKKIAPDLKILFISGYPVDIIDRKNLSGKKKNIMSKPVMPEKLLRKIREVLDN
jgi:two-component system cell cycle sensor histidine kinase/response regulator CckA